MYAAAGVKEVVKEVRGEDTTKPNETMEAAKQGISDAWEEVKIGAGGAYEGGAAVGTSLSENTHKAIKHDFGDEADEVAKGEFLRVVFATFSRIPLLMTCSLRALCTHLPLQTSELSIRISLL